MPPPPPPPPNRHSKAGATEKEENIYIPSFISKRPFYAADETTSATTDYLDHQRLHKKSDDSSSKWYDRGRKAGPAATKYRKGACENCGAMTHKQKDCLSRPRARGAKWTGKDIQADEVIQDVRLGWDAKRDRWNGYDAKDYMVVVEEHERLEVLKKEARRKIKGSDATHSGIGGESKEEDGEEDEEEGDKYAEANDMSKHQSTATRQLRIREDMAKYLLNLDLDSAKYDPKTRTLVDAGATNDKAAELFAEQGFMRGSGDAREFEKAQRYAWEQQEMSGNTSLHMQANPTAGEILRKQLVQEEEKKKAERKKLLKETYGINDEDGDGDNADGTRGLPEALRRAAVTENEAFIEYDEMGLVKGAPRRVAKSRYAEDVLANNHTSVFGSWWADFKWGYRCCHSFVRNSYCTGEDGIQAWEASQRQRTGEGMLAITKGEDEEWEDKEVNKKEEGEEEEEKKMKVMGNKEKVRRVTKKRTAADMMDGVTEDELEEYHKKKVAADDPMAKYLGKDELI